MFSKTIPAALALLIAAGAGHAQTLTGHEQLAAQAGIDPAAYSTAQIVEITSARAANDFARADYLLSQGSTVSRGAATTATPVAAVRQFEASLGVEPGRYTLDELVALRAAEATDQRARASYLLSGETGGTGDAANAGKAQLAAQLGLDPADYTLAQLVNIRASIERDDSTSR